MQRPRPVLTGAAFTGLLQSVVGILAFLGYQAQADNLSGQVQAIVSVGAAVVLLGTNIVHGLFAETKVTPLVSPMTSDGVPLVPVSGAVAVVAPGDHEA